MRTRHDITFKQAHDVFLRMDLYGRIEISDNGCAEDLIAIDTADGIHVGLDRCRIHLETK